MQVDVSRKNIASFTNTKPTYGQPAPTYPTSVEDITVKMPYWQSLTCSIS